MRKTGFTLERHKKLGLELAGIKDWLAEIAVEIINSHRKDSPVARLSIKMTDSLDEVRCALDDIACQFPDGGPELYYPPSELRKKPFSHPEICPHKYD